MKHNRVANIEQAREVMRRARVATMTGQRARHIQSAGERARDLAHVAELEAKLEGWRKEFAVQESRLQGLLPTTIGADARSGPASLGRWKRPMVFMSADLARVLSAWRPPRRAQAAKVRVQSLRGRLSAVIHPCRPLVRSSE